MSMNITTMHAIFQGAKMAFCVHECVLWVGVVLLY